jgi:hypothetical protein
MSFDDLQKIAEPQQAAPPAPPPSAPAPEPAFGGETRAFPRMSFEDLEKMTEQAAPTPPPPPPAAAESLPWEEQTPAFGDETHSLPSSFSLDEPQHAAPEPPPAIHEPESPFGEESPAFAGETRAFTKMSFEDLQQLAPPVAAPEPEPEPAPFETSHEAPVEPEISSSPIAAAAEPVAPVPGDLTDEQVERIARRVVQLLSADEVKKIAWEVIPDMAEMVVKERIRQLESEA